MIASDTIALIVDPDFGLSVRDIAARVQHTWIVETAANVAIVEQIRKESPKRLDHMMENGITTFRQFGPDPESWCDTTLDSVDVHHNSNSGGGGYSVLEVYGISLTERLHLACVELEFSVFTETDYGFCAQRPGP
ncbi:hypothetical protein [Burkholderia stagnalis]|uniref:hypothetical protein n=1 Tax=Burkholderia stagnalis TaxID=1503054 RepID=UPI0012D96B6E|nr:hypothetical protein [Burkholderia stagnalis]